MFCDASLKYDTHCAMLRVFVGENDAQLVYLVFAATRWRWVWNWKRITAQFYTCRSWKKWTEWRSFPAVCSANRASRSRVRDKQTLHLPADYGDVHPCRHFATILPVLRRFIHLDRFLRKPGCWCSCLGCFHPPIYFSWWPRIPDHRDSCLSLWTGSVLCYQCSQAAFMWLCWMNCDHHDSRVFIALFFSL